MTYESNDITPSDLSSNTILMIGRGDDRTKRFDLGIKAMKHIVSEIPQSEMKMPYSSNIARSELNLIFFQI